MNKKLDIQRFAIGVPDEGYKSKVYLRLNWNTTPPESPITIQLIVDNEVYGEAEFSSSSNLTVFPSGAFDTTPWGGDITNGFTVNGWANEILATVVHDTSIQNKVISFNIVNGGIIDSFTIDGSDGSSMNGTENLYVTAYASATSSDSENTYSGAVLWFDRVGNTGDSDLIKQPDGTYKISEVPIYDNTYLEERGYPQGAVHVGWQCEKITPSEFTNEELQKMWFSENIITLLIPLEFSLMYEVQESPSTPSNTAINGIRLNGQQPSSVYIGNQEIIKIIYNGKVIYNKEEGLPGHTYADLAAMTHEQLAQYTHAELAGE